MHNHKSKHRKWSKLRVDRRLISVLISLFLMTLLCILPFSAGAETYVKDDYTWVMDGTTSVAVNVYDASLNVIYPQFYHSSYTTDGITRHLYSLPDNSPFAPANGAWFQIEWSVDMNNDQGSFIGDGKRVEFIYFVRDGYDYIGTDYVIDGDAINPGKSSYVRFGSTKVYLESATEVRKYANYTGYRYSVPCPSGTVSVDEVYFSAFYRGTGQASVWSNCFSDIYLRSYTDDPLVGETFEPFDDSTFTDLENQEETLRNELNSGAIDEIFGTGSIIAHNSFMTGVSAIKGMIDTLFRRFPPLGWLFSISLSIGLSAFILNLVVAGISMFRRD